MELLRAVCSTAGRALGAVLAAGAAAAALAWCLCGALRNLRLVSRLRLALQVYLREHTPRP